MDYSNESSSESSSSTETNPDIEDSGEDYNVEYDENVIQPYAFEPVDETVSDTDLVEEMSADESSENAINRLENLDWCTCTHCQIMDRVEESVCCHEVLACAQKNEEVAQVEEIDIPGCITDNPGFQAVCLNYWVLQAAWNQYRQQYGTRAYEGPEHKKQRHVAYRQLVRWCWGVLGKEIRVPLPSCSVSCIRAHFPPPGLEDDFVFEGFRFADE